MDMLVENEEDINIMSSEAELKATVKQMAVIDYGEPNRCLLRI